MLTTSGRQRTSLLFAIALTSAILALTAYELVIQWQLVAQKGQVGDDFAFYRSVGDRWLSTGSFYRPEQLTGPYAMELNVAVLYPPLALLLFVPFTILPAVLWWVTPLGIIGYQILKMRPRPWTWPLLALIAFWPRTIGGILYGNTDMWIAAFVAAGTLWSWPAPWVLIKPTFAPLALIGAPRRAWWVGLLIVAAASLAMLPLWLDYAVAIGNAQGLPADYSLLNLPIAVAPVIAWIGRTTGAPPISLHPLHLTFRHGIRDRSRPG